MRSAYRDGGPGTSVIGDAAEAMAAPAVKLVVERDAA